MLLRLSERCRALRAAAGLTQQAAAEKAGLAVTYVQVIERGTTNPSLAILWALAKAYGVTLSEMLKGV